MKVVQRFKLALFSSMYHWHNLSVRNCPVINGQEMNACCEHYCRNWR